MMKLLRSQSQSVLLVILIVLGGSFVFYGVGNIFTGSSGRGNDFGRIDGQDLSVAELYQAVRATHDSLILAGHGQEISKPGGRALVAQEAWRQLLLLHEADLLHVQVSDQDVIDAIRHLPLFQKNGVYSPDAYKAQLSMWQNTFNISPDAFETVLRNRLRTDAVSRALFSTVRTSMRDVSDQYDKFYGPTVVSLVTLDPATMVAQMKVTPDEIQAEYKAHPDDAAYRTQEKRKVDYVLWPLTSEQAKLPAKEKAAAIEALGEKALDFVLSLQPEPTNATPAPAPDFQSAAKKKGFSPVTSDFFTVDTPPAGMPPSPAFNNAAFALSKDNPISKVIELDNGVAVLHLDDIQASELRPLNEVSGEITQQLQKNKAKQQAQVTAQIMAQILRAETAKGENFKTAAAAQKLSVQTLPPFVVAKVEQGDLRLGTIAYASSSLAVGAVSDPVPVEGSDSIVIIHVDSRAPADPAGLADFESRFRDKQNEQVRNLAYADWANWMSKQPGTHPPPDLDQYGGVE